MYTVADFELGERHVIKNKKVALDRLQVRQNVFLVKYEFTPKSTQQHVDRRAAKRTAASLVVHFVGTRLTEALITA